MLIESCFLRRAVVLTDGCPLRSRHSYWTDRSVSRPLTADDRVECRLKFALESSGTQTCLVGGSVRGETWFGLRRPTTGLCITRVPGLYSGPRVLFSGTRLVDSCLGTGALQVLPNAIPFVGWAALCPCVSRCLFGSFFGRRQIISPVSK